MNLFLKSYKIYFIFFLVIALKGSELLGNRVDTIHYLTPRILKYNLPNKYIRTQNRSFIKSDKGIIYIGKDNGVLVLDGSSTSFMPMPGPVYLVSYKGDIIYYLAENDLGTLSYSTSDGITVKSAIDNIDTHFSVFFPYNIIATDSHLFMATSEGVFIHHEADYGHQFFNRKNCTLLSCGEEVFLDVEKDGLYKWHDSLFIPVARSGDFGGGRVVTIIKPDRDYKLVTSSGSAYSIDSSYSTVKSIPRLSINSRNIQTIRTFSNGLELCLTEGNGVSISSGDGKLLNILSESSALPLAPIIDVFADEFNDIWLLYSFELYKLEYPSYINTLKLQDKISGTILKTLVIDNYIYIGTTEGLEIINMVDSDKWRFEEGVKSEDNYINLISSSGKSAFAAGNFSAYEIRGTKVSFVDNGNFSCIYGVSESTFLACKDEGLIEYTRDGENWNNQMIDPSISYVCSMIRYRDKIWFIGEASSIGVYDPSTGEVKKLVNLPKNPDQIVTLGEELFIVGNRMLWSWSEGEQKFQEVKDDLLTNTFVNSDIIVPENNALWMLNHHDQAGYFISTYDLENGVNLFRGISSTPEIDIILDLNSNSEYLWLTGPDQIMRISLDFPAETNLNTVRIEKVSKFVTESKSLTIRPNDRIPYSKDAITFYLDNIRFQNDPAPFYRYRLSHYQEYWSEWNQNREIRFTGLWERHYTFEAQTRTITGSISDPVQFEFYVSPPFYRSLLAYILYGLILFISVFLLLKWRLLSFQRVESRVEAEIKEKMDNLLREKAQADKLVDDMFPKGTAEELKLKGRAKSEKYEMATVLFSDIQGFTKIAEEMNPEVLIDELDKFFFHFDSVVENYNIEKIKTIGDAYMAAGGIPIKNSTNPVEVVLAGLEMQQYMNDLKRSKTDIWDLRIGIHTGPVISGVVGHKKLSYDIWGDTVNTASRMESSGEGGKVNISGSTYALVKDYFLCEYRGKLPVKYKGNIDMYFVTGLRPELSVDLQGIPNRRFFLKLQLLRMKDVEDRIFNNLLVEHPETFHFHSREHIHHVYSQADLLCRAENISEEETLLTLSASLLLYSGLSESYDHSENKSVAIAREILPEYEYSERQIDEICNLILATKTPFNPQNVLESILIDAKMEYLGRPEFPKMIKLLYLEMKSNEREIPMSKFIKEQITILRNFKYYTVAGQRLREISGEDQIAALESGE